MMVDPVVEEVRSRDRRFTVRYGNDVNALLRALQERARTHPERVVDTVKAISAAALEEPLPT